jgi:ubiquinone/menaquinone biosynthesis C-methylase UbiE
LAPYRVYKKPDLAKTEWLAPQASEGSIGVKMRIGAWTRSQATETQGINAGNLSSHRAAIPKAPLLASCAPYYWRLLKSLPYGAARRLTQRKCFRYALMDPFFNNGYGLELGGPSPTFWGNKLIPVYDRARQIDNCNFSSRTIWDANARRPKSGFAFNNEYVGEASDLSQIKDGTYDFLLASHVLEHLANPLRALEEWRRVLAPAGAMLVIVPDRRGTFDHRRAPTGFEHLESDYRENRSEQDLTHLDEILALHDLGLDPGAGSPPQFRERCLNNATVRAMHHHVFIPEVLVRMFSRMQMRVLSVAIERPAHLIAFAQRVTAAESEEVEEHNFQLLSADAEWRRRDPL